VSAAGPEPITGEFREHSSELRARSVPLSHLSVEVGHLYMEDLVAGPERLQALFEQVAPWARAATAAVQVRAGRPRVSTCFLVDDYFAELDSPAQIVPEILAAAQRAGVVIHYLVREAACARAVGRNGQVSPAELLISSLVEEPEPGTTGWRPPAVKSGWLSNGRRSPAALEALAAMDVREWAAPVQNAARRHSIFVDVQLWDDDGPERTWSCPLLAAAWQLLRLGLLRQYGQPAVEPVDQPETWPPQWSQLPAITRMDPKAPPFAAYASLSVLSPRFLPVELAVRTILGQVGADPLVVQQIADRAGAEGVPFAVDALDRIQYVFAGSASVDPPT